MPDKVSLQFNPRGDGTFNKPFPQQLDYFKQKLNLPTEHYDDILKSAHDRAFMVAGAAKADLLDDLRKAVERSIADGKGIEWFREQFSDIVKKHGWDYKGGFDWRTRVIYSTNMRASYAAGRYAQLNDPDLLAVRPYWQYVHNDSVQHPRDLHKAWSAKPVVLKHDDPWWQTHYPPNGWGCRCTIRAVNAKAFNGDAAPDDGTYNFVDRNGEIHNLPKGIDYGWDYAPGRSNAALMQQVITKDTVAPWQLAKANVKELIKSPVFAEFFHGKMDGEFPVAVLAPPVQALLGSNVQLVLLSKQTIGTHLKDHPDIGIEDYAAAQDIIDLGHIYRQTVGRLIFLWQSGEAFYRAALKGTADKQKNYYLSVFKTTPEKAEKEVVQRYERLR